MSLVDYNINSAKIETCRVVYKKLLYIMNSEKIMFIDITSEMVVSEIPKVIDEKHTFHTLCFNEKKPNSCGAIIYSTVEKVHCIREAESTVTDLDTVNIRTSKVVLSDDQLTFDGTKFHVNKDRTQYIITCKNNCFKFFKGKDT